MNRDLLLGKWHKFKEKIKEKWAKLSANDLTQVKDQKESLFGKLQSHHGHSKEKAKNELIDFEPSYGCEITREDKIHPK